MSLSLLLLCSLSSSGLFKLAANCYRCLWGNWGWWLVLSAGGCGRPGKGVLTVTGVLVTAVVVAPDGAEPAVNTGGGRCKR